jgi:hypothetical protein
MFNIKIDGLDEATRFISDLHRKQIPFATAKALTDTAKDARAAIVEHLQGEFTLRTAWWKQGNKYGINVKAAKKNDLAAEVFTRAQWMELHETGGVKIPRRRNLAIPSTFVKRSKKDLITKANRPRALKNSFVRRSKTGQETIFQRINKKQIRPMYFLEKQAQIQPAFRFYHTASRVVNERWAQNFEKAIEFAIRTAR